MAFCFRWTGALFALVLTLVSCASNDTEIAAPTTSSATNQQDIPDAGALTDDLEPLAGFAFGTVVGAESPLSVLVAETAEQRSQGLMGVTNLGGWTGMWFEFAEVSSGGFWMKDTLLALSIAWIDVDGIVVAIADMEPCEADPCPSYRPGAEYISALEVEQGQLGELGIGLGTRLVLSR